MLEGEALRQAVREAVRRTSARHVAREIGVAHTLIAAYVRDNDPSNPYGPTLARIAEWVATGGVRAPFNEREAAAGKFEALAKWADDMAKAARQAAEEVRGTPATVRPPASVGEAVAQDDRARAQVAAAKEKPRRRGAG